MGWRLLGCGSLCAWRLLRGWKFQALEDWNVLARRQWKTLNGLAKLFFRPVSTTGQRNLKFVANFPKSDSGDAVLRCHLYQRLFPYFSLKLLAFPGFHGLSWISFAEVSKKSIKMVWN